MNTENRNSIEHLPSLGVDPQQIPTPRTTEKLEAILKVFKDPRNALIELTDWANQLERELVQKEQEFELFSTILNADVQCLQSLQSELSKKEQQLEESDKTLLEVLNEKQSLQSERDTLQQAVKQCEDAINIHIVMEADLRTERDKLRKAIERVIRGCREDAEQWEKYPEYRDSIIGSVIANRQILEEALNPTTTQ